MFVVVSAYPDLIRLVNGNVMGLPKLIIEFREFWRLKEEGKNPLEESLMMDTPDEEKAEADSPREGRSPDKEVKKYSISKRQLEKSIKEIAVYEKRSTFKKTCWYVNDDVIQKYEMKDLTVPTQWKWITRTVNPVKETTEAPGENGTSGRVTPSIPAPQKQAGSITKFTVAGLGPKVHEPSVVKPVATTAGESNVAAAPSTSGVSSSKDKEKDSKPTKSIADMFHKMPKPNKPSSNKALKTAPAAPTALPDPLADDDDCAIVAVDLKPDKNQPSVKSMFKPVLNSKSGTKRKSLDPSQNQAKKKNVGATKDSKKKETINKENKSASAAAKEPVKREIKKTALLSAIKNPGVIVTKKTKPDEEKTEAKKKNEDKAKPETGVKRKATASSVKRKDTTAKNTAGKKAGVVKKKSATQDKKSEDKSVSGKGTEESPMEID